MSSGGTLKCGWHLTGHPRPEFMLQSSTPVVCPVCLAEKSEKDVMTAKTGMCLSNPYHLCPKEHLTPQGCVCSCHKSNKPVPDPQEVVDLYTEAGRPDLVIPPNKDVPAQAPSLVLRKRKPNNARRKLQS